MGNPHRLTRQPPVTPGDSAARVAGPSRAQPSGYRPGRKSARRRNAH